MLLILFDILYMLNLRNRFPGKSKFTMISLFAFWSENGILLENKQHVAHVRKYNREVEY